MINSISIIIPLFNEEKKISILSNQIKNLKKLKILIEVLLVNDGSTDNTLKEIRKIKNCKIINYSKNKGKGYAIKKGVLSASHQWILTADADCSVDLTYFLNWLKLNLLDSKINIYFGSRNLKQSIVKKKLYRGIMGKVLIFFLMFFLNIKIKDTQCGYKLYRSDIAKSIFKKLTIYNFSHDLQLVNIAFKKGYFIKELPVKWIHKNNSKVVFFRDIPKFLHTIIKLKYDF